MPQYIVDCWSVGFFSLNFSSTKPPFLSRFPHISSISPCISLVIHSPSYVQKCENSAAKTARNLPTSLASSSPRGVFGSGACCTSELRGTWIEQWKHSLCLMDYYGLMVDHSGL